MKWITCEQLKFFFKISSILIENCGSIDMCHKNLSYLLMSWSLLFPCTGFFCCCFLLVKGQLSFHYRLNNNNSKRFVKLFQSLWSLCLGYWVNVSLWAEFNIQIGQDIKHPWGVCSKAGTYLVLSSVGSIAILFVFTDEETELQRR